MNAKTNFIQIIKSLIDDLNELPHRDSNRLDAFLKRADMIIRKVFGDSSKYLKDLNEIGFSPVCGGLFDECWTSGKSSMLNLLNTMVEDLDLSGDLMKTGEASKVGGKLSNQIFVVHGHNEAMKHDVARTLEKLELNPIILDEKPNAGRTIIEKFTEYSNVSFAVVLFSPDDVGYAKGHQTDAKTRARQNVILELGFFIGKLGREKIFVLYQDQEEQDFEMPSDYSGVLYTPYNMSGRWNLKLVDELKNCGYDVDANKL